MKARWWTAGLLVVAVFVTWRLLASGGGVSAAERRSLARHQVLQLPVAIPQAWEQQLRQALSRGPEVRLIDADALEVARGLLLELPWVDPGSVEARLQLPDGVRVEFAPRRLALAVLIDGQRTALAEDGSVLPKGLSRGVLEALPVVPLPSGTRLPAPGRRVADPLVQEALSVLPELQAVEERTGLDLLAIERRPGYPSDSPGVAPALALVTRGGARIGWGRSWETVDPLGVPFEVKLRRLLRVLQRYPSLEGVSFADIDSPKVQVYDLVAAELPLP